MFILKLLLVEIINNTIDYLDLDISSLESFYLVIENYYSNETLVKTRYPLLYGSLNDNSLKDWKGILLIMLGCRNIDSYIKFGYDADTSFHKVYIFKYYKHIFSKIINNKLQLTNHMWITLVGSFGKRNEYHYYSYLIMLLQDVENADIILKSNELVDIIVYMPDVIDSHPCKYKKLDNLTKEIISSRDCLQFVSKLYKYDRLDLLKFTMILWIDQCKKFSLIKSSISFKIKMLLNMMYGLGISHNSKDYFNLIWDTRSIIMKI